MLEGNQYTDVEARNEVKNNEKNYRQQEEEITIFGTRPIPHHEEVPIAALDAEESFKPHSEITFSNILWSLLFGWWVALIFIVLGIVFLCTIYMYQHGLFCFKLARYIIYPCGHYAHRHRKPLGPENIFTKAVWILLSPIFLIPSFASIFLSWESIFYIPMASKFLPGIIKMCFNRPTEIEFFPLIDHAPASRHMPLQWLQNTGSSIYFRYTFMSFEILFINLTPFIVIALACGFLGKEGSFLDDPMFGTFMSLIGAVPCAYVIGICVDDLSHSLGLILGSIINAFFLMLVELILYYLSLAKGLTDVVRSAVVGAFLMNLLIIPGCGMFAAGLKWHEVRLNKKSQSISGTFLLLAVIGVMFPSVYYQIHAHVDFGCDKCVFGDTGNLNCSLCNSSALADLEKDPVYTKYASPLMYAMAIIMPIIYVIGMVFSLRTHKHIFVTKKLSEESKDDHAPKQISNNNQQAITTSNDSLTSSLLTNDKDQLDNFEQGENNESGEESQMSTCLAIIILITATVLFSLMAHVMTEKIPQAIDKMGFSQRFVGLVFYTMIPNCAEYMNAVKFALNGNIGLSMELGNQAAMQTSLIEMPALVLLSLVQHKITGAAQFTLVFPFIDIFCVIVAVFLRNSILQEKFVNYFTGIAFLLVFLLICVVYYFEFF